MDQWIDLMDWFIYKRHNHINMGMATKMDLMDLDSSRKKSKQGNVSKNKP